MDTSRQLDLSKLTTKQLTQLLWTLKGTPQAQSLYRELSHRTPRFSLKPDDPEWEDKLSGLIIQHFAVSEQG